MSEKPLSFSTTKVNKIAQCPGSEYKKFNTTHTPNSNLQRWKSINDAIIDWLVNQAPDEVAITQAEEKLFSILIEEGREHGMSAGSLAAIL